MKKNFSPDRYQAHIPLLFGQKEFEALGGRSRASILDSEDSTTCRHIQWAFLRLTGEIRNRTNHFDTKARLVDIFACNVLLPAKDSAGHANHKLEDYKRYEIGPAAEKAFSELLRFDLDIQKQILVDELARLQVTRYLPKADLRNVLPYILPQGDDLTLITPKFKSVLRRAQNLAANHPASLSEALIKFENLDLEGLVQRERGVDHFKAGLLRQVYDQGFARWLSEKKNDPEWVTAAVQAVTAAKKARKEEVRQENGDHPYGLEPTAVEQLSLDQVGDLDALQSALLSMTMSDERLNRAYRVDRKRQSERSGWIVEFQRELYAHMFAEFLSCSDGLNRILAAREVAEESPSNDRAVIEKLVDELSWTSPVETHLEDWNAQFYAWLYMIPSDQVSRLRHQFRKSAALADKTTKLVGYRTHSELSDERRQAIIAQFDRLMGLYTSVQSAGFGGKEHERAALATGLDFSALYEDETQFSTVYSDDFEDHHTSFPGTRRGLRQLLRFGQANVLKDIFERHKIQAEEVQAFIGMQTDSSKKDLFAERRALHELIVKENKNEKANPVELLQTCNAYRVAATDTAIYAFQANSARLTDHARLHYLLMKIVGRLVDFTLIWERDNSYALLGLLYKTVQARGGELELIRQNATKSDNTRYAAEEIWLSLPTSNAPIQLCLWSDRYGWSLNYGDQADALNSFLPGWALDEYRLYFHKSPSENGKDSRARQDSERDGKEVRRSHHARGKFQIRHDFAHYNVLHTKADPRNPSKDTDVKSYNLNLCYLVNAVRSLLSYDRKLKNTVIKTISDLLFEEGFIVSWSFKGDRVKNPVIFPRVETHLAFVDRRKFEAGPRRDRRKLETAAEKGVAFDMPRHSPRYTSMVTAMFDFGASGNGLDVRDVRGGKAKRVRYPGTPEGAKWNVPNKIAGLEIVSKR